jgi:hypothetical protein
MFEIRYQLYDQLIENTLWFEEALPWTSGTLTEQCEVLLDWAVDNILPSVSADLTIREVFGTSMESDTAPTGSVVPDTTQAGDIPAFSAPGGTCLSVTFRTGNRGRSYRGRNYISGIPSSALSGNQINPLFAASMVAAYNTLRTDVPELMGTWVVVSRFSAGAPRVTGVTTPVTAVAVHDLNLDSQRRRLSGRGS